MPGRMNTQSRNGIARARVKAMKRGRRMLKIAIRGFEYSTAPTRTINRGASSRSSTNRWRDLTSRCSLVGSSLPSLGLSNSSSLATMLSGVMTSGITWYHINQRSGQNAFISFLVSAREYYNIRPWDCTGSDACSPLWIQDVRASIMSNVTKLLIHRDTINASITLGHDHECLKPNEKQTWRVHDQT